MSAKTHSVRCAGQTRYFPITLGDSAPVQEPSCGWRGRRRNDREYFGPHGMEWAAEIEPCPRCGGQVELIPQEDVW
jgi:hypothetical protein